MQTTFKQQYNMSNNKNLTVSVWQTINCLNVYATESYPSLGFLRITV